VAGRLAREPPADRAVQFDRERGVTTDRRQMGEVVVVQRGLEDVMAKRKRVVLNSERLTRWGPREAAPPRR